MAGIVGVVGNLETASVVCATSLLMHHPTFERRRLLTEERLYLASRAREMGVSFEVDSEGHDIVAFLEVCADTSERHGGFSGGHVVASDFVDRFLRALGRYTLFFHARHAGRIVSSEMVLLSGDTVRPGATAP